MIERTAEASVASAAELSAGDAAAEFRQRDVGRIRVIEWSADRFDVTTADDAGRRLMEAVRERDRVILDLGSLRYVDWFGFEAILQAVLACPGKVRFASVTAEVETLFVLHGLRNVFSLHDTVLGALAAFDADASVSGTRG